MKHIEPISRQAVSPRKAVDLDDVWAFLFNTVNLIGATLGIVQQVDDVTEKKSGDTQFLPM